MTNGFTFTQFYILSSLNPKEEYTANDLFKYIETERNNNGYDFELTHAKFQGIDQLQIIIKKINEQTLTGQIPLIHFECHGDPLDGLFFKDGTEIKWEALFEIITEINISSKFNLFVGLAACFGLNFIDKMNPVRPSPCWAVIAPVNEVDPGEVISGFRNFYGVLLRTGSVNEANRALKSAQGAWYMNNAEAWYYGCIKNYIETHCTPQALEPIISARHSQLLESGRNVSLLQIKENFMKHQLNYLTHRYFDQYFSTHVIPGNKHRFANVQNITQKLISDLRETGKYWI